MRKISIGKQYFADIRENDYFYVDKTDFIREWWESEDETTLITRPRRFGKTLNMNMLECIFSVEYADRGDLFEGLAIWNEEKYRRLQGTYPVIFLTFADVKAEDCQGALTQIKQNITDLYNRNDYLLKGNLLNENERAQYASVEPGMDNTVAAAAIRAMANYLSRYYGKKVILLLDEYDTPMQEAYVSGYWDKITAFFRSMFNATFKTNPFLERAVMTGITRVSKESVFSDLNNLNVITTTSEKYATSFGFTEAEVFAALQEAGIPEQMEGVKKWYDGFTFGVYSDIYNPWSITNFLEKREYAAYWAETSSNHLVSKLIREGSPDVKETMEDLLRGGSLKLELDEQIVFNQLIQTEDAIWSLLLASGYLKVAGRKFQEQTGGFCYELELTNFEVRRMFNRMIAEWFAAPKARYNDFIKALLADDLEAMNEYMNEVAFVTFSSFDTGKSSSGSDAPERLPTGKATTKGLTEPNPSVCFYHGFVLGLMVELKDRYEITSNRESGFGRYDVMLTPREKGKLFPIIIEFKVHRPKHEKSLADTVAAAHRQIEEKKYDAALLERGYEAGEIRHYGFAFRGRQVLIG